MTIERAAETESSRCNGKHTLVGTITTGTNVVAFKDPLANNVASLAYLLTR